MPKTILQALAPIVFLIVVADVVIYLVHLTGG